MKTNVLDNTRVLRLKGLLDTGKRAEFEKLAWMWIKSETFTIHDFRKIIQIAEDAAKGSVK